MLEPVFASPDFRRDSQDFFADASCVGGGTISTASTTSSLPSLVGVTVITTAGARAVSAARAAGAGAADGSSGCGASAGCDSAESGSCVFLNRLKKLNMV